MDPITCFVLSVVISSLITVGGHAIINSAAPPPRKKQGPRDFKTNRLHKPPKQ